jgi:hypothetical protein
MPIIQNTNKLHTIYHIEIYRGHRGRDHMVDGFTTTYAINVLLYENTVLAQCFYKQTLVQHHSASIVFH